MCQAKSIARGFEGPYIDFFAQECVFEILEASHETPLKITPLEEVYMDRNALQPA